MPGASTMQTSSIDTNPLEKLPTELKCALLENLTDTHSLRNLVHASPRYHTAYLSAREAILTRVTFRELWNRNIDLSQTTSLVQVCHVRPDQPVALHVKWTLRQLRRHDTGLEQLKTIRGSPILTISQCRSLLSLGRVIWKPFVYLYDADADLFPHYPVHIIEDERYNHRRNDRDRKKDVSASRYVAAGWDAYFLDDVRDGCLYTLFQRVLRVTEWFLFFPGRGDWWNLVSSAPEVVSWDP
ncbi:MAG: hypothetical protein Q9195_004066 [Heterodermia aff. obscurata]